MNKYLKAIAKRVLPKAILDLFKAPKIYSATKDYTIMVSDTPKLKGKTALVTGGNGAIGRAICFKLAAEGVKVYVSGRNKEKVNAVVNEILAKGLVAEPHIMDVSDADSIEKGFDEIFNQDNKLDILINCASGGSREKMASLDKQSVEVIDDILNSK